jgi:hypothetical protein
MKVQVNLGLKDKSHAQLLVDADNYTGDMTGNANFSASDIVAAVTATKTATTNMRNACNAPKSETKEDNIIIARDVLERNLTILSHKVEDTANSPSTLDANRLAVLHSSGMSDKNHPAPQKHKFTATNTEISGTVHLTAEGMVNGHNWEYTSDVINFTNKIAVDPTTTSYTDITGLAKKTEYAFFHKAIKAKTKTAIEGQYFWL